MSFASTPFVCSRVAGSPSQPPSFAHSLLRYRSRYRWSSLRIYTYPRSSHLSLRPALVYCSLLLNATTPLRSRRFDSEYYVFFISAPHSDSPRLRLVTHADSFVASRRLRLRSLLELLSRQGRESASLRSLTCSLARASLGDPPRRTKDPRSSPSLNRVL